MERDTMEFDVIIVGAGPAGLSTAIRLLQLAQENEYELTLCVVEKGSEIGSHIVSGAVFETRALDELLPDWKAKGAPLNTPVTEDHIAVLRNAEKHISVPSLFAPKTMHNDGNYIISVGAFTRWLGEQAESLGAEIFPGFPASEFIIEGGQVTGIITGDMGIGKDGTKKGSYTPGMALKAKYTLFAEGSRGHLGKQLMSQFNLEADAEAQHYGIGIKELWDVPAENHTAGLVMHTAGWPLDESGSAGGSFLYHLDNNQVAVGLITDLSYSNPHVSPFDEFQRLKHHPIISQYLKGGTRVSYGARTITKGGLQALPKMHFPGGLLIGCNAGTLNFAKIKGTHTAMKSGMIAAETVFAALCSETAQADLTQYATAFKASWAYEELHVQRNFGPAQHKWGNILGSAYVFVDINLFNGKLPWTLHDPVADHLKLKPAAECKKIQYPKPDGKLSFDKLSSVFLSNTNHEEDQPCHLKLKDAAVPISVNLALYDEPAQRYCPAGVYEIIQDKPEDAPVLQINAANCVHCKTCDIKDPTQNITWVAPEGGGGPNYPNM